MANSETRPLVPTHIAPVVYTPATGTASGTIFNQSLRELASGEGSAFVLEAPTMGQRVDIVNAASATAGRSVVTHATTTTLTNSGLRTATFQGVGSLSLYGMSSTRWVVLNASNVIFS